MHFSRYIKRTKGVMGMDKEGKKLVQKVFSENKQAYVTSNTHAKGADLLAIPDWLSLSATDRVLDIATGGGHVARTLSPYVDQMYATDLTKEMLAEAARHLQSFVNIHYITADAENLPFLNNSFDHVVCRIAAHHFPSPNCFVKEVERVLKPGGSFLLIDNIASETDSFDIFINTLEKLRDRSHHRSLKISEWKQIFYRNQLKITKEQTRKKTLPFDNWLHRTVQDKKWRQKVSTFVLTAGPNILNHYQFEIKEKRIHSFALDEWMVLGTKL